MDPLVSTLRTIPQVSGGAPTVAGAIIEAEVAIDIAGVSVPVRVRVTHLGHDPDRPGHVRLRHEVWLDDPRVMASMAGLAIALGDTAELAQIRQLASEVELLHERVSEVSIDPRTMIPSWAWSDLRTRIHAREPGVLDEDLDTRETHEWSFTVAR